MKRKFARSRKLKRRSRPYKKRAYVRRRGYGNVSRQRTSVVSDRQIVRLKYVALVELNVAANMLGTYVFRLNSLYDPDLTSTGHQPMGFDQWSSMYYNYRVFKTFINVKLALNTQNPATVAFCITPFALTTSSVDITRLIEQPYCKYRHYEYEVPQRAYKRMVHIPKIVNQTVLQYRGDDNNWALTNANPAQVCNFTIVAGGTVPANAVDLQGVVELVFFAEMFGRGQLAPS